MQKLRSFTPSASWDTLPVEQGKTVEILNNSGALLELRWAHDTDSGHQISLKDGQSVRLNPSAFVSEIEAQGAGTDDVSLVIE
jgi:hypothetical protein